MMPAPVSATAISTSESTRRVVTVTRPPAGVNFTAFDSRFQNTCCRRRASALIGSAARRRSTANSTPFALAVGRMLSSRIHTMRCTDSGASCNRIWPVIMRETSRTSAISCACTCAFRSTMSRTRGMRAGSICDWRSIEPIPGWR